MGGYGNSREYLPDRPYDDVLAFLVPTRMYLRKDWGTAIGSCHSHWADLRTSSKSRPPIQSTTRLADNSSEAAQSRNEPNSPSAREQTYSSGAKSSESSSYRLISTLVFSSSSSRITSARNVPFFILDSTSNSSKSGFRIFIGIPGNPAPEPMSASRPELSGTAIAPNMDSQK